MKHPAMWAMLILLCSAGVLSGASLRRSPPALTLSETVHDFGEIERGTIVEHIFVIRNSGGDTLKISSTRASCGCTAAVVDEKSIPPGGESRLKVTFNSNNKGAGHITKTVTITSNTDPPTTVVTIEGTIVVDPSQHKTTMMHLDGIFKGDCAKCHVEKGVGKFGAELYAADCAVCHGPKSEKKPGPTLTSNQMLSHGAVQLERIIRHGLRGTNMPAFTTRELGPLSDEQIGSVVEYITAVKREVQAKQ